MSTVARAPQLVPLLARYVGGGLADLWERAGHQVTRIGRDDGDVSAAEVVLVVVPGGSIAAALDKLEGNRSRHDIQTSD